MVASIVNRGLINDELFFESNGEIWVVWDRMHTIVPIWRSAFKNPQLFSNIEDTCKRLEAWRERRAPGSSAAMRQMMDQARQKAGSCVGSSARGVLRPAGVLSVPEPHGFRKRRRRRFGLCRGLGNPKAVAAGSFCFVKRDIHFVQHFLDRS